MWMILTWKTKVVKQVYNMRLQVSVDFLNKYNTEMHSALVVKKCKKKKMVDEVYFQIEKRSLWGFKESLFKV